MGAAVGDYDNDGRDDVLRHGARTASYLFHNRGGRFEEVAAGAGVADSGWGTSAAWFDYDGDGLLDLFVCRYVDWIAEEGPLLHARREDEVLLHARALPGTSVAPLPQPGRRPLRGRRRRRRESGTTNQKALGVAPWDFNGDGTRGLPRRQRHGPQQPLPQQGRRDASRTSAVEAGVAVDEAGRSRGAMGVSWGDTKNGKGAALAIGNFSNELKSLYWTESGEVFLDESPRSGVGPTSLLSLTFGLFFFDAGPRRPPRPLARQRPRPSRRSQAFEGRDALQSCRSCT